MLAQIAQHGEPFEPRGEGALEGEGDDGRPVLFADAVALFRSGKAITRLKPSTRKGYEEVLSTWLLPRFGERPLEAITFAEVVRLDADMVRAGASSSRRGNVQVVLRSVLRAALDAGELAAMPRLPPLPKQGRKVLIPLSADQVEKILAVASPAQRLAFALAAYAGLRAGEVRALRWADVELDEGGGGAGPGGGGGAGEGRRGAGGLLVVRFSMTKGETTTPKSGHEVSVRRTPCSRRVSSPRRLPGPWASDGRNPQNQHPQTAPRLPERRGARRQCARAGPPAPQTNRSPPTSRPRRRPRRRLASEAGQPRRRRPRRQRRANPPPTLRVPTADDVRR